MIEIELETLCKSELPATHGRFLHAMWLKLLEKTDNTMSDSLHGQMDTKPFAISPIYIPGEIPGKPPKILEANQIVVFRLNLMDNNVIRQGHAALSQAMLGGHVNVGSVSFRVIGMRILRAQETSDLYTEGKSLAATRIFEINFRTLTCFRHKGRSLLFPEPRLWIAGLARKWRELGGMDQAVNPDVLRRLAEDIYPVRYSLHTGAMDEGRYLLSGFTGICIFEADTGICSDDMNTLYTLLLLSDYTGIGYKTTMGMGQVSFRIIRESLDEGKEGDEERKLY